jgi:predicted short-subunit dehydrogenase-like oxidoreductase (DUF2520 family)
VSRIADADIAVGVVGPGRVGAVLAAALASVGTPVTGWSGRVSTRPATALPPVPRLALVDLVAASGVVLIAVRDDQLPGVVAELAGLELRPLPSRQRRIAWHVSGRFGIGVLAPLGPTAWSAVAAAPAMTFTGEPADLRRLRGSRWAMTGEPDGLGSVGGLIAAVGGTTQSVDEADRTLLHAALSLASNHLGTLQRAAADLLRGIGIADPTAFLRPLAEAALDDAWSAEPRFTGPVSRGDTAAVSEHLRAIRQVGDGPTAALYAALTRATAAQALGAGVLGSAEAAAIVAATAGEDG